MMDISGMSTAQRAWWLMVMPILAGLGVYQLISWLPDPLYLIAIIVLAVGSLIWSIRQIRWTKRVQAEIREDLEELERRHG
jgi:hypothetical protein